MKIGTLIIALFIAQHASSQCPVHSLFRTDSIGTKNEKLFFPLAFDIKPDSINVFVSTNDKEPFMMFKIAGMTECKWDEKFTNGITQYDVIPTNNSKMKRATIKVVYDSNKRWIEILYPQAEERIFTIAQ